MSEKWVEVPPLWSVSVPEMLHAIMPEGTVTKAVDVADGNKTVVFTYSWQYDSVFGTPPMEPRVERQKPEVL